MMKLTRKVLRKLISEQINLSKQQKQEIDELIKIIDAKKAGAERRDAMFKFMDLARKITGKTFYSYRGALLALDYIEPRLP